MPLQPNTCMCAHTTVEKVPTCDVHGHSPSLSVSMSLSVCLPINLPQSQVLTQMYTWRIRTVTPHYLPSIYSECVHTAEGTESSRREQGNRRWGWRGQAVCQDVCMYQVCMRVCSPGWKMQASTWLKSSVGQIKIHG